MTLTAEVSWTHIEETMNCNVYAARKDLLVFIPHDEVRETEETARANLQAQTRYWQSQGNGGAVIISMDPILDQAANARAVYAKEAGESGTRCFALIGESYFAMAASMVYTGLARPSVPIEVFRSLQEAMPWIDEELSKDPA